MSILGTTQRGLVLLVLMIVMVSGCSFGSAAPQQEVESEAKTEGAIGASEAVAPADEAVPAAPVEAARSSEPVAGPDASVASSGSAEAAPMPTVVMMEADSEMAAAGESVESYAVEVQQSEPLRAGEVNDNAQWDDYLLYRRNYQGAPVHDRDVSERYLIEVKDGQGNPVLGATVRVFLSGQPRQEIYSARTYANGQVLFHPLALNMPLDQVDNFVVEVQKDNLLEQFTLTRWNTQVSTTFSERWTVTLDTQASFDSLDLDVC